MRRADHIIDLDRARASRRRSVVQGTRRISRSTVAPRPAAAENPLCHPTPHGTAIVRRRRAMGRDPRRARETIKKCGRAFFGRTFSGIRHFRSGNRRNGRRLLPAVKDAPGGRASAAQGHQKHDPRFPARKHSRPFTKSISRRSVKRRARRRRPYIKVSTNGSFTDSFVSRMRGYSPSGFRFNYRCAVGNVRGQGRDQAGDELSPEQLCAV